MKLVCLYTNSRDLNALNLFKTSRIYQKLKNNKNYLVLDVFGDGTHTIFNNKLNKVKLKCHDKYTSLSLKTYEMIKFCTENFNFTHIIKIDPNILEYKNRHNIFMDYDCLNHFYNEDRISKIIFDNESESYFGTHLISYVSKKSYEQWAFDKKITNVNYDLEFGIERFPSFYTGKLYGVSFDFACYIAKYGKNLAYNHMKNLGGSEDTFVGRLFAKYIKKTNWPYDSPWVCDLKESFTFLTNI
jgi:hypothetical protein